MNAPDSYRVILIDTSDKPLVKVFVSWSSTYLGGDSWTINSGTELITEDEDSYFFYGYSGSCYKLRKSSQGNLTTYATGIYNQVLQQDFVKEITVQEAINILKGETN